jgi:hypothetical protein
MRLSNAPTNALRVVTTAPTDACATAPTNAANARRTRPPIPPRAFVCASRAHPTRTQTRCRWCGPRVRMLTSTVPSQFRNQDHRSSHHAGKRRSPNAGAAGGRYSADHRQAYAKDENSIVASTLAAAVSLRGGVAKSQRVPGVAARPVDSFAAIGRHSTAGSARTHQRAPQRICRLGLSFAITGPNERKACNSAICAPPALACLQCVCASHCRGLPIDRPEGTSAGALSAITTLAERKTRARWPSQAPPGPITIRGRNQIRNRGGWGGIWRSLVYFMCLPNFAPPQPETLGVPPQRSCTADGDLRR